MQKTKAIVIDDDAYTREQMWHLINTFFPEIKLLQLCENARQGLSAINSDSPEIVFLDIEMPGMSGFEMLEQLKDINFEIIFITSFNQYAIKAIRFSALDYLLKPITEDELRTALERYKAKVNSADARGRVKNFIRNMKSEHQKDFKLAIATTEGTFFLDTDDIVRCEGDINYTKFHMLKEKKIISSRTLKEFEELLADHHFIRVHKSHLVNKKHVRSITGDHRLQMKDGSVVDISKRKFSEVKMLLHAG